MTETVQQILDTVLQMLYDIFDPIVFSLLPILLFVCFPIFLIIIAIQFIVYIFKNRKYKKGAYYHITKVPFLLLKNESGKYEEYLIYEQLKHFEKDGAKFLFNVYIPKDNGETTEIPVLMLTQKGIFVFESKDYSGWIFGSEDQKIWYQTLPFKICQNNKAQFYNPIMQNSSHIKYLRALIGEQLPIYSIIAFSESCTLKDITVKSNDIKVIKCDKASLAVSDICNAVSESILTDEDIANLYSKLYPYTQISET